MFTASWSTRQRSQLLPRARHGVGARGAVVAGARRCATARLTRPARSHCKPAILSWGHAGLRHSNSCTAALRPRGLSRRQDPGRLSGTAARGTGAGPTCVNRGAHWSGTPGACGSSMSVRYPPRRTAATAAHACGCGGCTAAERRRLAGAAPEFDCSQAVRSSRHLPSSMRLLAASRSVAPSPSACRVPRASPQRGLACRCGGLQGRTLSNGQQRS